MTSPDDIDDLFGPPPTAPAPPAAPDAADKTALPGGIEARKEARVRVKWPARVLLPDGSVVQLRVHDVSETGVALVSERPITSNAQLRVAIAVPHVEMPERHTVVTGTFKTAHVTVSGLDLIYGGVWLEIQESGREQIRKWIRKLRR